ncbi:MAG: riboflavin synthase [Phycisphaerae bacterium]|jgi:riboflavin synthase
MFAGIVETLGKVVTAAESPQRDASGAWAHRLVVSLGDLLTGLRPGASVAINGACLTLVEARDGTGLFDVVPETWQNTNLRRLRPGDLVNAERSLRVGDRIDGHFVQGHIDGIGRVERIERTTGQWKLWVTAPPETMPFIVRKGSIALDGTSLTVVDVGPANLSVALIPTTLEQTVLRQRQPGDEVNIETDILARIVLSRTAADHAGALTFDSLREGGFL